MMGGARAHVTRPARQLVDFLDIVITKLVCTQRCFFALHFVSAVLIIKYIYLLVLHYGKHTYFLHVHPGCLNGYKSQVMEEDCGSC